jgi:hypothetical protein
VAAVRVALALLLLQATQVDQAAVVAYPRFHLQAVLALLIKVMQAVLVELTLILIMVAVAAVVQAQLVRHSPLAQAVKAAQVLILQLQDHQ